MKENELTISKEMQLEIERLVEVHKRDGKGELLWDKKQGCITIIPAAFFRYIQYALAGFLFLLSSGIPFLLMFIINSDTGNILTNGQYLVATIMFSFLFLTFISIGVLSIMVGNRIQPATLNFCNKTIHWMQKEYSTDDIEGIYIRKNLWIERFRLLVIEDILDEELKSVTVGVRMHDSIFLGFHKLMLMMFKHFKDAKAFQLILATVYECKQLNSQNTLF